MNNSSDRVIQLLKELNMSPSYFSRQCGYSQPTTIYNIVNKGGIPSQKTVDKICSKFTHINKDWILTGFGDMFIKDEKDNIPLIIEEDLTLTATQIIKTLEPKIQSVIDTIVPKMLRHDLVTKAEVLMNNLLETVESFNNVKSVLDLHTIELEAIHKKINSIERMAAMRVIKDATKKNKGGLDLN
tara:strand:- start:718 stop:1272 length:555 start_codon:yes stop_codon:yes gene_type:complete